MRSVRVFARPSMVRILGVAQTAARALLRVAVSYAARRTEGQPRLDVTKMSCAAAMHAMTPDLMPSDHLRELTDVAEAIDRGERRAVIVTVPPRFGKSETICHILAWLIARHPQLATVYATYSQSLSDQMSKKTRRLAESNGFDFLADGNRMNSWHNAQGGGLLATGVQGPFTGFGVGLAILDDPVANRSDAESVTVRESTWSWITDVLFRGLETFEMNGVVTLPSVIVVQTRWHTDDPSGRLLAGKSDRFKTWQHIHLRPIVVDENGVERSLWPEKWPLEELQAIRGNGTSRTWQSLYEGDPQPEGSTMFGDPVYGEFPAEEAA